LFDLTDVIQIKKNIFIHLTGALVGLGAPFFVSVGKQSSKIEAINYSNI